ncbi:uncharacterized protein [Nicotiana sylvestris]|uniref:uncharacterized protein n=1 Tax=Nicotiana sylvestris TaxID=4096 RepID=UPI00388C8C15
MNKVERSNFFNEAQQALNRDLVLHHEIFLRSRLEIIQLEFELKEQVLKKDIYRAISEQQDEALKDLPILQAELEKAQNEALSLKGEHDDLADKVNIFEATNEKLLVVTNNATLQVQEKVDLIDQLRAEIDEVKATTEAWEGSMDLLASEKEDTKVELTSAEYQLRMAKNKADKWSRLNDKLRAQLNSTVMERDALSQEYAALRSKLDVTSIDSSDVGEMLVQYKANVEVVEARLKMNIEYVKRLSWRESLEEIHARGTNMVLSNSNDPLGNVIAEEEVDDLEQDEVPLAPQSQRRGWSANSNLNDNIPNPPLGPPRMAPRRGYFTGIANQNAYKHLEGYRLEGLHGLPEAKQGDLQGPFPIAIP